MCCYCALILSERPHICSLKLPLGTGWSYIRTCRSVKRKSGIIAHDALTLFGLLAFIPFSFFDSLQNLMYKRLLSGTKEIQYFFCALAKPITEHPLAHFLPEVFSVMRRLYHRCLSFDRSAVFEAQDQAVHLRHMHFSHLVSSSWWN